MGSSAWETGKVLVEFAGGNSYVFMAYQGYGMWGGLWYFGDSCWEPGMAQGGAVELNLIAARHFCSIILHASNVSSMCHVTYCTTVT